MSIVEEQCCENCVYWDMAAMLVGELAESEFAECRRFPPTRIYVPPHEIAKYDQREGDPPRHMSKRPETASFDWCGEWKRRELAVVPG